MDEIATEPTAEAEPIPAPEPEAAPVVEPVAEPVLDPDGNAPLDKAPPHASVDPAPTDFPVSLETWVAHQFSATQAAALLGGFQHEEAAKGRHLDLPAAYAERFAAFAERPTDMNEA